LDACNPQQKVNNKDRKSGIEFPGQRAKDEWAAAWYTTQTGKFILNHVKERNTLLIFAPPNPPLSGAKDPSKPSYLQQNRANRPFCRLCTSSRVSAADNAVGAGWPLHASLTHFEMLHLRLLTPEAAQTDKKS
jgi:hypothetical protein